jgi:hypothetical protein
MDPIIYEGNEEEVEDGGGGGPYFDDSNIENFK